MFHLFIPYPHLALCFFFLIVPIVLPLPEFHSQNHTIYAFSHWLLSLRNTSLSFLHIFSWFNSSFLLNAKYIPLSEHTMASSTTEGHFGGLQVLEVTYIAVLNVHVQVSLWT